MAEPEADRQVWLCTWADADGVEARIALSADGVAEAAASAVAFCGQQIAEGAHVTALMLVKPGWHVTRTETWHATERERRNP